MESRKNEYFVEKFTLQLLADLAETSPLEWFAVISGVSYVILVAFEKRAGWIFAAMSTFTYIYLCLIAQLYIESFLQLFYFIMAIYGWLVWKKSKTHTTPIIRWPLKYHIANIVISGVLVLLIGYLVGSFTNQSSPYLDAFSTIFSLLATFMVAKKVLENWLYWIAIDTVLIFLYASRGYALTGVQYGVFTILALIAYLRWRKIYISYDKNSHNRT